MDEWKIGFNNTLKLFTKGMEIIQNSPFIANGIEQTTIDKIKRIRMTIASMQDDLQKHEENMKLLKRKHKKEEMKEMRKKRKFRNLEILSFVAEDLNFFCLMQNILPLVFFTLPWRTLLCTSSSFLLSLAMVFVFSSSLTSITSIISVEISLNDAL